MDHDLPSIPDSLVENLAFNLGEAAAVSWLEGAVVRARVLVQEWALRPLEVLSGGSMSLCIKCAGADGELLVLKIPASIDGGAAERSNDRRDRATIRPDLTRMSDGRLGRPIP